MTLAELLMGAVLYAVTVTGVAGYAIGRLSGSRR